MKKLKKRRLHLISFALCLTMVMGVLNPTAWAQDIEAVEEVQAGEVELWEPDLEEAPFNVEGDLSLEELADRVLPEEDMPEVISAEAIEENNHVNRLWAQETDMNTIIFQNRDGKKTMYYFADAVKYTDENGIIHDKRTNITELIDKPVYREEYAYVNAKNDIKTYFPKTLSADKGVILETDDIKIEMAPVSGRGFERAVIDDTIITIDPVNPPVSQDVDTGSDSFLPKKLLEVEAKSSAAVKSSSEMSAGRVKDIVNFGDVFGAETEIRYTPQFNGFKEDIILNNYTGVNEFTFRIKTNGLSLINEEGIYLFADPLTGEKLACLGDLIVYDSFVPEISAEVNGTESTLQGKPEKQELPEMTEEEVQALYFPEESGAAEPVYNHEYIVEAVAQDEEYLLTISMDDNWLTDESRVYPVIIDPSITIGASGIQDATIYSNYDANDSSNGSIHAGNYSKAYGARGVARALVKFPGLMSNATFKSLGESRIDSVKYIPRDLMCYNASVDITAFRVTAPWTESTVKCNSGNIWNAYSSSYLDWFYVQYNKGTGSTGTGTGNFYPYDITDVVKEWKCGYYGGTSNHYGIMLKAWNENDKAVTFGSRRNTSYPPRVIVTYDTTVPVSQVCVNPSSITLNVNESRNLSSYVSILPPDASNKGFYWDTNTTSPVATITSSGLVCAKGPGTVTFTVRSSESSSKYTYCTVTVVDSFNYTSTSYNSTLALNCAEYAMLAYDEMGKNSSGLYYDTGTRKSTPTALISKLGNDKFTSIKNYNYGDKVDSNVSYVLAKKQVSVNGSTRTLVPIIIRGTDGVEWKGNMDVTGSSYNSSLNYHYSFNEAAMGVKNGLTTYLLSQGVSNPVYLITGHSRGAAVANLLAQTLTSTVGASSVFAYTFATPNNIKTPNTSRTNIRNFVFNDDFVPQVPLTGWGYGKHGVTYTKTAGTLYTNNTSFKNDMKGYVSRSKGRSEASFNLSGTNNLLNYVSGTWANVQEYYKEDHLLYNGGLGGIHLYSTLYNFFRNTVAPAAMGDSMAGADLAATAINANEYQTIAKFFVGGSGKLMFDNYIYDAHHAFTYYTAVKYGLFP